MGICVSCRRRDRKAPEKRSGVGLGAGGPAKGPAAAELLPRRVDYLPAMANSISNIKMTNPIKGIVSKRRKRYIKDGFNLDLAYITDRLIAMGFPAEKLEGVYRNHIDEVYRFLEQMHKDHYKIYNLCSERSYDTSKFQGRVERYAFEDHTPPNMELIQPFCEDVHKWLSEDSRNVAAVHCKAGKGRTGTMVCCYLLYSGQKATADEALQFYGTKRTHDEKGVTIPSQRRYVEYYAALVRSGLQYAHTAVYIRELVMCPPPMLNGGQCTLELTVSQAQPPFKAPHGCHEVRKHARAVRVCLTHCTPLSGDVRVDVYNKPKMMMRKEKLFHFWFNTFFLVCEVGAQRVPSPADSPNQETYKLTLNKWQLDDAHKDKQHKLYSPDFKVELIVQKQPDTSTFSSRPLRAPSPPSSSASDCSERPVARDDDSEHWDSGEHAPPPPPPLPPLPPLPPPPLHSAAAPRQDHTDPCDANLTHSKSDASKRSKYKSSKRTVLDDPSSQRNCSAADSDDPAQCSYKQDCKVRLAGDGQPYKELVYRLTDPIVGSSTYTKTDPAARCAERNCDVGSQVSTELECELLTSSDLASGRSSRAQSPRDSNMDADRSPNTSDAPGESFETMFTEPSLPHPDFYRSNVFADDRNFRSTIFQTDLTIDQNYIRLDAPTKSRTLWGPDVKDRDYSEDHMFFDFSGNRSTKPTHAEPHRHPDDLSETSLNKNKPHKLKYTTEPSCKQHKSPKSKFDKSYRTYPEPIDRPTVIQDSKLDNKINTDPNMKSDRKPNPDSPPDMFLNADKTFSPNFKTDSKNYIKFTCIPPNSALTECKFKPGDPYSILPDVESKNRAYPNVTINQEFAKHDYDEQNQSISRTLTEPCCKADKPSIKSDYHLLAPPEQPDNRTLSKPRLSLTDVKASWREFSGKFSDNRKKRDKD